MHRLWLLLSDPDTSVSLAARWLLSLLAILWGIFWIVEAFDLSLSVLPGLWNQAAKTSGSARWPAWISAVILTSLLALGWYLFRLSDRLVRPYTDPSHTPVPLGPRPDDDPFHTQQRTLQSLREVERLRRHPPAAAGTLEQPDR